MTDLQVTQKNTGLTVEQKELIKKQIMVGATDMELKMFHSVCEKTGLDPFSRQIYAVGRKTKNNTTGLWEMKFSYQVSIDGFRLVAERSGKYQGQTPVFWCLKGRQWVDVLEAHETPIAAKVGVWKAGNKEPTYAVAHYKSYVQEYNGKPSKMWEKMPELMLAKCAEALALRKAFPQELSGLYTVEEMGQARTVDNAKRTFVSVDNNDKKKYLIGCCDTIKSFVGEKVFEEKKEIFIKQFFGTTDKAEIVKLNLQKIKNIREKIINYFESLKNEKKQSDINPFLDKQNYLDGTYLMISNFVKNLNLSVDEKTKLMKDFFGTTDKDKILKLSLDELKKIRTNVSEYFKNKGGQK